MRLRPHIHRLHGRHVLLDAALAQELRRPEPDARFVAEIKKRKLQVKDRLRALELKAASEGLHA
jgi:hypothetical protein